MIFEPLFIPHIIKDSFDFIKGCLMETMMKKTLLGTHMI